MQILFALVFFLRFGSIEAMGSSSDVKSVDPRILIKQSIFLPGFVVRMGDGIFCGLVNIYNGGGSWWSTSTLCCERFWLCINNLGGMKRERVVGSFLVCDKNSSVLVRWRKITPVELE